MTQYSNEITGTQTKELQPSRELSGGWRECQSDEGHIYYFNDATGASSWEFPADVADIHKDSGESIFPWVSPRAPLPLQMKTPLLENDADIREQPPEAGLRTPVNELSLSTVS